MGAIAIAAPVPNHHQQGLSEDGCHCHRRSLGRRPSHLAANGRFDGFCTAAMKVRFGRSATVREQRRSSIAPERLLTAAACGSGARFEGIFAQRVRIRLT